MSKHKIICRLLFSLCILLYLFTELKAQETITGNIMHNGINRNYRLRLPKNHSVNEKIPLVFNLHGFTSNAIQQELYSGMNAVADVERFAVCYPNGVGSAWNVGWTFGSNADDVGFISLLIDDLSSKYNFNKNKVYSCGMSNGGFMSYKLACELNNKIAAIASVTGSMTPGATTLCNSENTVPIMEIHGTSDNTVAYNGTPSISISIPELLKFWQNKNGCDLNPIIEMVPNSNVGDNTTSERHTYVNCENGKEVIHYKVIGGGHTWPGAGITTGPTSQDFVASATIWEFFNRFTLDETSSVTDGKVTKPTIITLNPIHEKLFIRHHSIPTDIQIFNAQGYLIAKLTIDGGENEIDVAYLNRGLYYIQIENQPSLKFTKI